jgi:hypothetical protein
MKRWLLTDKSVRTKIATGSGSFDGLTRSRLGNHPRAGAFADWCTRKWKSIVVLANECPTAILAELLTSARSYANLRRAKHSKCRARTV